MNINELFTLEEYDEAYQSLLQLGEDKFTIVEVDYNPEKPQTQRRFKIVQYRTDEDIQRDFITSLRELREIECFAVINRGSLWFETLTEEQKEDLRAWYQAWLNVTETKVIPVKPNWLK